MEIISRLKIKYLLTLSLLMIATMLFSTVAVLAATNVNFNANLSVTYNAPCVLTDATTFRNAIPSDCTSLVGGNNTHYDPNYIDKTYARVDKSWQKGYLTLKT